MKPALCRSSWGAFVSTHPLMLPSTSPRETLLACPPGLPRNLPSFTVESTLSSSCSRPDPPLSRQGTAFAHLDSFPSHDLVLTSCSFCFWQRRLWSICQLLSLRPLFPFQQAQYAHVSLLKPAPFCTLFAGLGSTNKSATSLLSPPI